MEAIAGRFAAALERVVGFVSVVIGGFRLIFEESDEEGGGV